MSKLSDVSATDTQRTTRCVRETIRIRNPAISRKSRPYRLRPKPSVRLPGTERKRFVRGDTVPCTC